MKLTTVAIAAAALAGAAGAASSASANATIFEEYQYTSEFGVDGTYYSVTNNTGSAFTDVNIAGTDLGSLAAGASTSFVGVGDPSITPSAVVTILDGGVTYTGTIHDVLGDIDINSAAFVAGSMIPEPASWALMLAGFAGLGVALRTRRKAPIAV